MAKAKYVNNYNPLFPNRGSQAVYGNKVYQYKSDGRITSVVKKAAYLPVRTYKDYKSSKSYRSTKKGYGKKGYGKIGFELN